MKYILIFVLSISASLGLPHQSKERESRVFKYVPLNSMTLANRKPTGEKKESSEAENESMSKDVKAPTKRPWWQNLPPKKSQKNKVILEEYDKLKSSLPEWPWMAALKKTDQNSNPLTRKTVNRDTVRAVMTSTPVSTMSTTDLKNQPQSMSTVKPQMSTSTLTTTTSSSSTLDTSTSTEKQPSEMQQEEKVEKLNLDEDAGDAWLALPTKIPHWFDNLSKNKPLKEQSKKEQRIEVQLPSEMEKDPFRFQNTPMLKVNGPSLTLPSFPITSQLTLFTDIEKRTGLLPEDEESFDLTFFDQRPEDMVEKYPLLSAKHNMGLAQLETTTTQKPLITQTLSPLENREALTQLVALYEQAPHLEGEMDKMEMKQYMEGDKQKMEEEIPMMTMMKEETSEQPRFPSEIQMGSKLDSSSGIQGIPHSVTLELASKKPIRSKPSQPQQNMPITSPFSKAEVKMNLNGMKVNENNQRTSEVKSTLKELLECNQEMMESVQIHMKRQTELLNQLMKLL